MNSSALESRDHGLEITTLVVTCIKFSDRSYYGFDQLREKYMYIVT